MHEVLHALERKFDGVGSLHECWPIMSLNAAFRPRHWRDTKRGEWRHFLGRYLSLLGFRLLRYCRSGKEERTNLTSHRKA